MTDLVNGLGGTYGFGEGSVPRNDDGSFLLNITSVFESGINFYGTTYTSLYINTNGNLTFGTGLSTYTPAGISGVTTPMIAPFFADVDARGTNGTASPGGTSAGTGQIWYDLDTVNDIVTITWDDVGFYNQNRTNVNAFQVQLIDLGAGEWTVRFLYEQIAWTAGQASGGNTSGLGGTTATAGFTAGNGTDFYELPTSGNQTAMLNLDVNNGNQGEEGTWEWLASNDTILDLTITGQSVAEISATGSVVGTLASPAAGPGAAFSLIDDAGGRFQIVGNQLQVADGLLLDYEQNTSHTVTVRVIDGADTVDFDLTIDVTDVNPETISNSSSTGYVLHGGALADAITSGSGNDDIVGGAGEDTLNGGAGSDTIDGGNGADIITGGADADQLSGGTGNDTFRMVAGDMVAGEAINGGSENDIVELNGGGTFDFRNVSVFNVEEIQATSTGASSVMHFNGELYAGLITSAAGSADEVHLTAFSNGLYDLDLLFQLADAGVETTTFAARGNDVSATLLDQGDADPSNDFIRLEFLDQAGGDEKFYVHMIKHFDRNGVIRFNETLYDDGRIASSWYDTAGELTSITINDGPSNAAAYQSVTVSYTGGVRTQSSVVLDNGVSSVTDYDTDGVTRLQVVASDLGDTFSYDTVTTIFNPDGSMSSRVTVFDAGETMAEMGIYYDATGILERQEMVYADGSFRESFFVGGALDHMVQTATDGALSIFGLAGNDDLQGGTLNDRLFGGDDNDTLDGAGGNDMLTGQAGNDVFVFSGAFGNDTICDFDQDGNDMLDLTAFGITSRTALDLAGAITQDGTSVVIDVSAVNPGFSGTITLARTDLSAIGNDDFVL